MAQPPIPQLPVGNPLDDAAKIAGGALAPLAQAMKGKTETMPNFTAPKGAPVPLSSPATVTLPTETFENLLDNAKLGPLMPEEMVALGSVSKELYTSGLLSQVIERAGNAVLQYVEAKTVIQGAIQEQMVQDLNTIKNTLQPLVSILPENVAISGAAATMKIPSLQMPVLQNTVFAPNINPQSLQAMTGLITQSAQGALQQFLQGGVVKPLSELEVKAQNLVGQLISLKVNSAKTPEVQIIIPEESLTTNMPVQQLGILKQNMISQLQQAHVEVTQLVKIAQAQGLSSSIINAFKYAPQEALALVRDVPFTENNLILAYLGVWVANRKAIETAVLQMPYEQLHMRKETVKAIIAALTDQRGRPILSQDQKMSLLEQLLQAMPSLLNYMTIGELLAEIENEAAAIARRVALQNLLLMNSAKEIILIASGKPNASYQSVGVLHDELGRLAEKLSTMLPKEGEELKEQKFQEFAREIANALQLVQNENPRLFREVLRYHPRSFLYLIFTDSPLMEEVSFPLIPELLFSTSTLSQFEELVSELSRYPEFAKYQPKVIAKLLSEAKADLSQAVARDSIKIAYSAAIEAISTLKRSDAEPLRARLSAFSLPPK